MALVHPQLNSSDIPAPVREAILATVVLILSSETCRLRATVSVRFQRIGLENFRLDRSPQDNLPSMRFRADLDGVRVVAEYAINPGYRCLGSTANLLHTLLAAIFGGRTHRASVPQGSIRLNILLRPNQGRIGGESRLRITNEIVVDKPFNWIPDDTWPDMLADFEVTAQGVEDQATERVEPSPEGLGIRVGELLSENLEINPLETVRSIALDHQSPANLRVTSILRDCVVFQGRLICWFRPTNPPPIRP